MDDEVLNAIRYKKSSMRLSINLVKDMTAHACVSAGNTGALMALSKIILKTMDGIIAQQFVLLYQRKMI